MTKNLWRHDLCLETTQPKTCQFTRLLVTIAYRVPVSLFLPGFLIGQIIGLSAGSYFNLGLSYKNYLDLFICGLVLTASISLRGFSLLRINACGLMTGVLSVLIVLPVRQIAQSQDATYLAFVDDQPAFPKPGQVELSLLVGVLPERFELKTDFLSEQNLKLDQRIKCKAVELPWKNIDKIEQGSVFVFRGKFLPLLASLSPFSYDHALLRQGYVGTCKIVYATSEFARSESWATKIRQQLVRQHRTILGDNEISELLLSMSIGSQDLLSLATSEAFKRTGLAHLLVVSGYQVGLIFACLFFISRRVFIRISIIRRQALVLPLSILAGMLAAIMFAWVSGIQGSSLRAALAVIFTALVMILERRAGFGNAILVSLLIISVIWPAVILDPGVELTFAALTGLWIGTSSQNKFSVLAALKACFYSTVCTSFVALCWFGTISLLGFILNPLLAAPVGALVCNSVLIGLITNFIGLDPTGVILKATAVFTTWFRDLIVYLASFSWAALSPSLGYRILQLVGLLLIIIRGLSKRMRIAWAEI